MHIPLNQGRTLILKGFEQEHLAGFVTGLIDRFDLDLVYWITEFDTKIPAGYADRIHLLPVTMMDRLSAVDWNAFLPIDNPLVDSMKKVESAVMTMFERSYAVHHSYVFRRRAYLQLLRMWYTLVSEPGFCGLLADILPHAPTDHTLYGLCRELNRPVLFFDNMLPGFITAWHHWAERPLGLPPAPSRVEGKATFEDLSDRAQLVYRAQTGEKGAATPWYMDPEHVRRYNRNAKRRLRQRVLRKPRTAEEKRALFRPTYLYSQLERLFTIRVRNRLKSRVLQRRLAAVARPVEPERLGRYLYLPLHMQPEVSSGPRNDAYVDQLLIVEQIAAAVPDDVTVVVKENPKQTGLYRDRDFYTTVARLRNVVVVPLAQDTFDLIAHAAAVVTGTGTAGWEAIFRGKPVICFGYPFYAAARGVRVVMTTAEVRAAVADLFAGRFDPPTLASSTAFLRALDAVALPGNLDAHRERLLASPAGHVTRLLDAVAQHLIDRTWAS